MLTSRNQRFLQLVDDRISDLPDSLLLHILSFIPTRWAAKTCILSKRWKPLWTSVPALIFEPDDDDDDDYTPTHVLFNSAKKLMQKNDSPWIQTLRVVSRRHDLCIHPSEVESLILEAIGRKVNEIYFRLPHVIFVNYEVLLGGSLKYDNFFVPEKMFSCKTLVVLKLNIAKMRVTVPTSPNLPSLKTILLDSVYYVDENSATHDLITCCPELENLSILNVRLLCGKFRIHTRKLKLLELDNSFYQHQSIQHDIDAPSLEFLNVKGCTHNSLSLTNAGCVKKASICWPSAPQSLVKFFQTCNNINNLSLSNTVKICPRHVEVIDFAGLEVVNLLNLTHITVEATSCWRSLLPYFFQCCPNLQVLKLVHKDKSFSCLRTGPCIYHPYLKLELLQPNLLSQLRAVELEGSWNSKDDLDMLKYILQNGKVLGSVRIHVHTERPQLYRPGEKTRELEKKFLKSEQKRSELDQLKLNIIQEVSSRCRASAACRITYS